MEEKPWAIERGESELADLKRAVGSLLREPVDLTASVIVVPTPLAIAAGLGLLIVFAIAIALAVKLL